MTKQTALKVRINLAIPVNHADSASMIGAAKAIEDLKAVAAKSGFVEVSETTALPGLHDFADTADKPADPASGKE